MTIAVVTTGGTIACTRTATGELSPTVPGAKLIEHLQSASHTDAPTAYEVHDLARLDSSSMTLTDIDQILTRVHTLLAATDEKTGQPRYDGIIVTHGTDSLEETAFALDLFHSDPRPVVVTGAQHAFDSDEPDGPANLFLAARTITDPSFRDQGVFIAFGGEVLPARGTTKTHTHHVSAFTCSHLVETGTPLPRPAALPVTSLSGVRVDCVSAYPGAPGSLLTHCVEDGADGIVVIAMGAGNVGTDMSTALNHALTKKVAVVITTRVPGGPIIASYGGDGGGARLSRAGAIGSGWLRAGQARIALAAALATDTDPAVLLSPQPQK